MKFENIETHLGCMNSGELIILAGRPGMGKTSLAIDIATNCKKTVLYFSLEDVDTTRTKCSKAKNIRLFETFHRNANEKCATELAVRVSEIRNHIIQQKDIADLIVIDYIQLLDTKNLFKELKALAQEIEKPILALSMTNRRAEYRKNHRPKINELKHINRKQFVYVDKILLLYRGSYYCDPCKNIAEVSVHKNPYTTQEIIFLRYETSQNGTSPSEHESKTAFSASRDDTIDNFDNDWGYAKQLAQKSAGQNTEECEKTVAELEILHEQYHKCYRGHMHGIYHEHDGANVIAWEYAKGLANLAFVQTCGDRTETLSRLETLYNTYDCDCIIAQAYADGLNVNGTVLLTPTK